MAEWFEGYFPLGGIFRAEQHFLLFKDQLAESGRQKTKENIIQRGKFRLVENSPKAHHSGSLGNVVFRGLSPGMTIIFFFS